MSPGFDSPKAQMGTILPSGKLNKLVADKLLPKPAWYKNTYFWIGIILFIVGIVGLPFIGGDKAIFDPGQKREGGLAWLYFGAAIVMLVNGYISHSQTVQLYNEQATSDKSSEGDSDKK